MVLGGFATEGSNRMTSVNEYQKIIGQIQLIESMGHKIVINNKRFQVVSGDVYDTLEEVIAFIDGGRAT